MARKTTREIIDAAKARIDNLSVAQVKAEMANNADAVLIDIREAHELLESGKIAGSQHVPRGTLEFWAEPAGKPPADLRLPDKEHPLREDQRIILHCAAGGRSAMAAAALKEMGFTNVAHLETGFNGWKEAGEAIDQVEEPDWTGGRS